MNMRLKTYLQVTTWLFLAIGVLHIWRAYKAYTIVIGHMHVRPEWSWLGAIVALYLSYQGYKHTK